MHLSFTLNGVAKTADIRPGESLLEVLRHRCGIVSLKDGCAPQGQCGCCLALIDGNPKMTCAVPAAKAQGAEILTLEGVSAEERDVCARAFAAAAGVQCGFCIPGFALRAKWLLDRNSHPSRAQIARATTTTAEKPVSSQRLHSPWPFSRPKLMPLFQTMVRSSGPGRGSVPLEGKSRPCKKKLPA